MKFARATPNTTSQTENFGAALRSRLVYRLGDDVFISFNRMKHHETRPKLEFNAQQNHAFDEVLGSPLCPTWASAGDYYSAFKIRDVSTSDRIMSRLRFSRSDFPYVYTSQGYFFEEKETKRWVAMEGCLRGIVDLIQQYSKVDDPNPSAPPLPEADKLHLPYDSYESLLVAVLSTRSALLLLASWTNFQILNCTDNFFTGSLNDSETWPPWCKKALEDPKSEYHGQEEFMADFFASQLFRFGPKTNLHRVGAFIHAGDFPSLDNLHILLSSSIPFTIVWPTHLIETHTQPPSSLKTNRERIHAAFRVTKEDERVLFPNQQSESGGWGGWGTNFDTSTASPWDSSPSTIPFYSELSDAESARLAETLSRVYVHPFDYFLERERVRITMQESETSTNDFQRRRQQRASAKETLLGYSCPRKAAVYKWVPYELDPDSVWRWERRRIERPDKLDWYGIKPNVKIYDEYSREWDIWTELWEGEGEPHLYYDKFDSRLGVANEELRPYLYHSFWQKRYSSGTLFTKNWALETRKCSNSAWTV